MDSAEFEPDEEFQVGLSNPSVGWMLKHPSQTVVTIIDDDDPGVLSVNEKVVHVMETAGEAVVWVLRQNGTRGEVSVDWETIDGSAVAGKDYTSGKGTLTFKDGNMKQAINVKLVDDDLPEPDKIFHVKLSNPVGGAILSAMKSAVVTVIDDDGLDAAAKDVASKLMAVDSAWNTRTSGWWEQLDSAMQLGSSFDEAGNQIPRAGIEYVMHFLTFFWKVIFAVVPPTRSGADGRASSWRSCSSAVSPQLSLSLPHSSVAPSDCPTP